MKCNLSAHICIACLVIGCEKRAGDLYDYESSSVADPVERYFSFDNWKGSTVRSKVLYQEEACIVTECDKDEFQARCARLGCGPIEDISAPVTVKYFVLTGSSSPKENSVQVARGMQAWKIPDTRRWCLLMYYDDERHLCYMILQWL